MLPKKHNRHNVSFKEERLLNFAFFEDLVPRGEKKEKKESAEKAEAAKKEKAVSNLTSKSKTSELAKEVDRKNSVKFDTEKADVNSVIDELKKESLAGKDFKVNKEFTKSFSNSDDAREALLTNRVKNGYTINTLVRDLGINQTELLDHTFGPGGLFGNLFYSADGDTLFKMSSLGNKYKDVETAEERLVELAEKNENPEEMQKIATTLDKVRALGEQLENLEARALTDIAPEDDSLPNYHPDYIKDIHFAGNADKLKEKFGGKPEVLVALMAYYYGIADATKEGYLGFSRDGDEYDLFIETIPEEDLAMFDEAYLKLDEARVSLFNKSLTDGIQTLYTSEKFTEIKNLLDAHRLEKARENGDTNELVKAIVAQIANPVKEGPITNDGKTLLPSEMLNRGEIAGNEGYVNRRYSEKAIYESILNKSENLETQQFSLESLSTTLNEYLAKGKMQILLDPGAMETYGNLSTKEFPQITPELLKGEGLTTEMLTLIRYGFVLDRKESNLIASTTESLEATLGRPQVQELGRVMMDLHLSPDKVERLGVGGSLIFALNDDGSIDLETGVNVDITDPKRTFVLVNVKFEDEEGNEGMVGTGIHPCSVNIGVSGKIMLDEKYYLRLSGGIGTLGPLLAGGVSAGFGRDLESYVTAHEDETLEKFYGGSKEVMAAFEKAFKENPDDTSKLAEIARQLQTSNGQKPLLEIYNAQLTRLKAANAVNDKTLAMLDQSTVELFKEFKDTLRISGMEQTDEFGWEINGGVAAVEGFGIVPFVAVTFEFPTGTVMRYSIPQGVPSTIAAQLEGSIQNQLKAQGVELGGNVMMSRTESDELFYDTGSGTWGVERVQVIPEIQTLMADPKKQAEQLTKYYNKYGINFEAIDDPAYENLSEQGYIAMTFNEEFIGDANLEVHVDPEAEGIHLTTLEGVKEGKVSFAANVRGAENLVITRREIIHPSGKPQIIITLSDSTKPFAQIAKEEASYYHYQNGKIELLDGTHNQENREHPNLAGPTKEFEAPYFTNLDESYFEASAKINAMLLDNYPNSLTNKGQLDQLVADLAKNPRTNEFLKEFANATTLRRRNWEHPETKKAVDMIKTAYEQKLGKKLDSPRELQYIFERLTESTFSRLDRAKTPAHREKILNQGLGIAEGFIKNAFNRHPQLKDKFTPDQEKAILTKISADFADKIKTMDLKDVENMFTTLEEAGVEQHYLFSTAAWTIMGPENYGFRFVDTNEQSTIEVLRGSLTDYKVDVKNPNSPESLVARFLLEINDPLPETNDIAGAKLLMQSQLAHKLATMPLPKVKGKDLGLMTVALGPADALRVSTMLDNPNDLTALLNVPENAAAYQEFHRLVTQVRKAQLEGKPLTMKFDDAIVILRFPTEAKSMFLQRCGNSTFSVHQKIVAQTYTPQQGLVGGSETAGYGYDAIASMDSVVFSVGASLDLEGRGDRDKDKDRKPPTEERTPPTDRETPPELKPDTVERDNVISER